MDKKELNNLKIASKKFIKNGFYEQAIDCLGRLFVEEVAIDSKGDSARNEILILRSTLKKRIKEDPAKYMDLLKKSYLITARYNFDDYCIVTEWNKPYINKFYLPRRRALLPIVKELQMLADDELDILCISQPPGTGKTGLAIFFITWLAGKNPKDGILSGSHNTSFLRGVYDECIREMDENGDYLWSEVFPERRIVKTNALDLKIDIDKEQRFSSLQFTSAGSGNAGKLRATQLLYCDDLIEGIEEALSKERLDKKWEKYTVDLRQRKMGKCKELHIATRWSVHDIIGRIEQNNKDNPRAHFLSIPALDENGNSNFDYGGSIGFDNKFYEDIKSTMDDASWRALYMNEPIEREGILYNPDELRRYYQLPADEPDAILAVCDTAEGGGDDTVLPVFAVYGNDHYLIDCVCTNGLPEITDPLCAEILVKNRVKLCQFESNSAGGRTADKVYELVKEKAKDVGIRATVITKKRTTQNKETKIIVNSSFIKEHCLFKDPYIIEKGSMYANFVNKMCTYSVAGKNKHDDVVDALAQYALFTDNITGMTIRVSNRIY